MRSQQNPISQIFVGVSIAVLSAFFLFKLGLQKQESVTPIIIREPVGNSLDQNGNQQPAKEQPEITYVTIAITDRLDINKSGRGQIAETVAIEINGETKNIHLSYGTGKIEGSTDFLLPGDGYYNYNLTCTTTFNCHYDDDQICTHNGYGSGRIYVRNGKVFKMEYDSKSITSVTSSYKTWLSDI